MPSCWRLWAVAAWTLVQQGDARKGDWGGVLRATAVILSTFCSSF